VQKVVLDHNHYLANPNKRQKMRSQRSVEEANRKLIGQMREGGMKPAQVFEFMVEPTKCHSYKLIAIMRLVDNARSI